MSEAQLLHWQTSVRFFFFSSRRRHTRLQGDWSSDVCSSDLAADGGPHVGAGSGPGQPPHDESLDTLDNERKERELRGRRCHICEGRPERASNCPYPRAKSDGRNVDGNFTEVEVPLRCRNRNDGIPGDDKRHRGKDGGGSQLTGSHNLSLPGLGFRSKSKRRPNSGVLGAIRRRSPAAFASYGLTRFKIGRMVLRSATLCLPTLNGAYRRPRNSTGPRPPNDRSWI